MPEPRSAAQLEALYQELILDHYRRPRHRGPLADADRTVELRNPLCGDALTVQVSVDGDVVREAAFTGHGCSISQAAASMLTDALAGCTLADARELLQRYDAMLHGHGAPDDDERFVELRALSGVARFPARVRCATLPAEALARAVSNQ